jgi:hypothetical protein
LLFELFPLFDLEFLQKIQFLNNYDRHWNETHIPVHYQMGNPLQQGRWPCGQHFLQVYWVSS